VGRASDALPATDALYSGWIDDLENFANNKSWVAVISHIQYHVNKILSL
jgi:hypothetical protein